MIDDNEIVLNEILKNDINEYLDNSGIKCKFNVNDLKLSENLIKVIKFDTIDSTHKLANELKAKNIEEKMYLFIISEEQSGGIGQRNNKWMSPIGNLYMSVKTKIKFRKDVNLLLIPQTVSLAIRSTIKLYTNENMDIKWINDLFYKDKKISGVLVHSDTSNNNNENEIILTLSLGVNLNISPFDNSICLKDIVKNEINVWEFCTKMQEQLIIYIEKLKKGETNWILAELNKNLLYINSDVIIWDDSFDNKLALGIFKGINNNGCALLQVNNQIKTIMHGRMRLNSSFYIHFFKFNSILKFFFYSSSLILCYYFTKYLYSKFIKTSLSKNNN